MRTGASRQRDSAPGGRDRRTRRVTARPPAPQSQAPARRQCACGGGCPVCSTGSAAPAGSDRAATRPAAASAPAGLDEVLAGSGRALDGETRTLMEARFGERFDAVRVHTGAAANRSARAIDARAYTLGPDIVFGRGEYAPHERAGRYLLAHELAHVVQQRGRRPALQPALRVAPDSDPAEREADHAAAAVLRGETVPALGRRAPALHRFPNVSCRGNVATVQTAEASPLHRVTRTRVLEPVTTRERPGVRVRPGIDAEDVFIVIEWCRGTVGRVRIGGDVPAQLLAFLQSAAGTIVNGGGFQEVVDALLNSRVTPFVDFDIADVGNVRISGGVGVSVGRGGPTAGSGRIRVRTGDVDIGIGVDVDARGRPSAQVDLRIPFGGPGRPDVDCSLKERVVIRARTTFRCEAFREAEQVTDTLLVPVQDRVVRTVFFNHAQSSVNHALSDPELALLRRHLDDNFTVTRIEGFTSPEGRQGPPGPGTGSFQGNDRLSLERAEAARALALERCPEGPADVPAGHCGIDNVESQASGELLTLTEPTPAGGEREVEGERLQSHAVNEFLTRDSEARYRTPEALAEIDQAPTRAAKAQAVYRRLRRVEIELIRNRMEQQQVTRTIPAGFRDVACPADVLQHARSCFAVTEPGPRR